MDIDSNDLLGTNEFILTPDLNPGLSKVNKQEFREYYEKEDIRKNELKVKSSIDKIELKNVQYNESTDSNNLLNTNSFEQGGENKVIKRSTRDIKTLVSIDSRDRDKILYPKPSDFDIFLGKAYRNVKQIELVSLEFPNTNAVINSSNNKIYWRNQEDIDLDITNTITGIVYYPVYNVELRIGSYTLSSLQTEITLQMNNIRRQDGNRNGIPITNGDFHFFVVDLDFETDIVTFNSLIMLNLANNTLETLSGTGLVTITTPTAHGYSTDTFIYMRGVKQTGGISASVLNGFQLITVTDSITFHFTVTVNASSTAVGGGNTMQSGKKAPFQLLWNNYENIVAQNIGYPLENSSSVISTDIISLQNFFQMKIILTTPHNFTQTYTYIGQTINIGSYIPNTTNFLNFRSFQITDIIDTNTILVQVTDNTVYNDMNDNLISLAYILNFNTTYLNVSFYNIYNINSFIITTSTPHNYFLSNILDSITLVNTADETVPNDPSYDGTYIINQIPSNTTIVLPGVIGILNAHTSGIYGTFNGFQPITTWVILISEIIPEFLPGYAKIITVVPHILQSGDKFIFQNITSVPVTTNVIYTIDTIYDDYSFLISLKIISLDQTNILNGSAAIRSGLIYVSSQSHNFNSMVSVIQGPDVNVNNSLIILLDGNELTITPTTVVVDAVSSGTVVSGLLYSVTIQTITNHNLTVGEIVRINFEDPAPTMGTRDLTGGYIVYSITSNDTFTLVDVNIPFSSYLDLPIPTINGIIGLSNEFSLYGIEEVGGISQNLLNGLQFTVRDIIDKDTFTFMSNAFAVSYEVGGGSAVYISSLLHGYNGAQTNTKNGILNRSINLEGENYCFLTSPQLDTMINTGSVINVFARISLDQPPGYVCFKYLSNPKIYYTLPLTILEILHFSITNYDNTEYEFSDLDFSFCLQITETIDTNDQFNISSRRGVTDSYTS